MNSKEFPPLQFFIIITYLDNKKQYFDNKKGKLAEILTSDCVGLRRFCIGFAEMHKKRYLPIAPTAANIFF